MLLVVSGGLTAYAVTRDSPAVAGAAGTTGATSAPQTPAPIGVAHTATHAAPHTVQDTSRIPPTTKASTAAPPARTETAPTGTAHATTQPVASTTRPVSTRPVRKTTPPPVTSTRPATTAATTTTGTTTAKPPATARIVDDFSKDYRDGTIWHQIVSGTGVDIGPTGGQLVISIGADAVPGGQYDVIEGHYGTQCSFPGDFDARVDYELLNWPDGGGVTIGLWAFFANAAIVRQNSSRWGDIYSAWVVPANGSTSLPDRSGSLRLTRVGSTITGWFLHDGTWRTLVSGRDSGTAVLGPTAQATRDDFGHQPVRVAFDNFSVEARQLSCPLGSQPPTTP